MDRATKDIIRKQIKKQKADIKKIRYFLHRLDTGQDIVVKGKVVRNKDYKGDE